MKKLLLYITAPLFISLSFLMINPAISYAGASNTCTVKGGSFFGFPTWYKYLQGEPVSVVDNPTGASPTPVTTCSPKFTGLSDTWLILAAVVDMLLYVAGLGSVIMIIFGGVRYTTSMGNPDATAQAKNTIIYSVIGLVIAITASFLVTFIATSVLGAS